MLTVLLFFFSFQYTSTLKPLVSRPMTWKDRDFDHPISDHFENPGTPVRIQY
jgi:hypothetical protein